MGFLSILLAHVLDFFLQLDPEPLADARFQLGDQSAEVGRGPRAGVVDQVGVIARYVNPAALFSPLPGPLPPRGSRTHAAGPLLARTAAAGTCAATPAGSSRSNRFLKMLPAHFMVTGNFSLRTFKISSAALRRAAASAGSRRNSTERIIQSLRCLKMLSR